MTKQSDLKVPFQTKTAFPCSKHGFEFIHSPRASLRDAVPTPSWPVLPLDQEPRTRNPLPIPSYLRAFVPQDWF